MIEKYFSKNIRTSLKNIELSRVKEIRIRLNKPLFVIDLEGEINTGYIVNGEDIEESFSKMCKFSPYAFQEEIKRGYITLDEGWRVGVCGIKSESGVIRLITSLNIRIARQVIGCSNSVISIIKGNVLIASLPGRGKTTLLRDIIKNWSNSGLNISVADERGEISGNNMDLGDRTDIIANLPKVQALNILLRSMAPDVIAVDELGGSEDIRAVIDIINSGVNVLATIHCSNIREVNYRLGEMYNRGLFDYIIFLSSNKRVGTIDKIYNREMEIIWQ